MKHFLLLCLLTAASLGFAQETENIDMRDWQRRSDALANQSDREIVDAADLIRQDTYNNARKNPIWCPTDSIWEERRQALGLRESAALAGCPTEGICDDPVVRDNTELVAKTVNIYVHLMRNSNGSGGVNIDNAIAAYNTMQADYAQSGISFNLVGAQWVNNTTYATIPAYSPFNNNWYNTIVNMKNDYAIYPRYVCNIFVSGQAPSGFGTLLGIGTFPWDPDATTKSGGLWMNNVAMTGASHTFAHELGHCFGLWHTHHGVSEVASCSNCYEYASGFEGDVRGDFCSDTPPTPTNYNCSGPGGNDCQGHAWGPTQPENLMGYGPDSCQSLFTTQQTRRIHCWLPDALPLWITQ